MQARCPLHLALSSVITKTAYCTIVRAMSAANELKTLCWCPHMTMCITRGPDYVTVGKVQPTDQPALFAEATSLFQNAPPAAPLAPGEAPPPTVSLQPLAIIIVVLSCPTVHSA